MKLYDVITQMSLIILLPQNLRYQKHEMLVKLTGSPIVFASPVLDMQQSTD
jgi:hypothetical protein